MTVARGEVAAKTRSARGRGSETSPNTHITLEKRDLGEGGDFQSALSFPAKNILVKIIYKNLRKNNVDIK